MEGLRQDLRYALRTLRRSPGFAAIAVLTLGLGIGATVAIFSVVHGVLLRPLPFPESDRLVRIWQANPGESIERGAISPVDFEDWYESRQAFAEMGAFLFDREMGGLDLTGEGEPERLAAAWVTRGFFPTLQVQPQLGRLPRPEEME
ncbi:MAG: ABC transporter permease, partial [Gemmatimonadota bacterium]|nr:ABC transporter permease [Gemmatimonadota bacterium]